MNQNHNELPLRSRLRELEDLFATALTGNKGVAELTFIWNQIKETRRQLNDPIYIGEHQLTEEAAYKSIPE